MSNILMSLTDDRDICMVMFAVINTSINSTEQETTKNVIRYLAKSQLLRPQTYVILTQLNIAGADIKTNDYRYKMSSTTRNCTVQGSPKCKPILNFQQMSY